MSFGALVSFLETSNLHFTRLDLFQDKLEGAWPSRDRKFLESSGGEVLTDFTTGMRARIAVSCWAAYEHESAAMWGVYAPGSESVAIKTTFGKLAELLEKTEFPPETLADAARVTYLDHFNDGLIDPTKIQEPLPNTLMPMMRKHISYQHEQEVRAVVVSPLNFLVQPDGVRVKVCVTDFIDSIVVSPFAAKWFYEAVSLYAKRLGLSDKIEPSVLTTTITP